MVFNIQADADKWIIIYMHFESVAYFQITLILSSFLWPICNNFVYIYQTTFWHTFCFSESI